MYIVKQGRDLHRGEGVFMLTEDILNQLFKEYQQGNQCNQLKNKNQSKKFKGQYAIHIQKYIDNPILYQDKKVEIRIFFLIISTDPLIIYMQEDPVIRICQNPYNKNINDRFSHVCNVSQGNDVSDLNIDQVINYLITEGVEQFKNTTQYDQIKSQKINKQEIINSIYKQTKEIIIKLTKQSQGVLFKNPIVNENFALDIIIDQNLKAWFLEINPNPGIQSQTQGRIIRHTRMLNDIYDLQFAYLRDRSQRIFNVIDKLADGNVEENLKNFNVQEYQKKINVNRKLEIENSFKLIYWE